MKLVRIAFALATLCISFSASAQDTRRSSSIMSPASYWTGSSVGANGGFIDKGNYTNRWEYPYGYFSEDSLNLKGTTFGIQMGHNWALNPYVVLGVALDWQQSSIKGDQSTLVCCTTYYHDMNVAIKQFATARGVLGVAHEKVLVYFTGGAVAAKLRVTDTYRDVGYNYATTTDSYGVGRALGGGIGVKVTNNVSMSGEYLNITAQPLHVSGSDGSVNDVKYGANIYRLKMDWHF